MTSLNVKSAPQNAVREAAGRAGQSLRAGRHHPGSLEGVASAVLRVVCDVQLFGSCAVSYIRRLQGTAVVHRSQQQPLASLCSANNWLHIGFRTCSSRTLCRAGGNKQQQPIANQPTAGPPDITKHMDDMEDVIMIDEDEEVGLVLLYTGNGNHGWNKRSAECRGSNSARRDSSTPS